MMDDMSMAPREQTKGAFRANDIHRLPKAV